MSVTKAELDALVGKSINDICTNHFSSEQENHCAHFVSHALNIKLATLCGDLKWATRRTGATVRCNELYNNLPQRGPWDQRPLAQSDGLLIFVISARDVVDNVMHPVPRKHVGIHFQGNIYNFSNGQHKVIVDSSVDAFHKKFKQAYHSNDISLYYGIAP